MSKISQNIPDLADDVVLSVRGVSKKFCRNLRRSMWYGIQDLAGNLLGGRAEGGDLRPEGEMGRSEGGKLKAERENFRSQVSSFIPSPPFQVSGFIPQPSAFPESPPIRRKDPRNQPQQRRLPTPVAPDEAQAFAALEIEGDVAQRPKL